MALPNFDVISNLTFTIPGLMGRAG